MDKAYILRINPPTPPPLALCKKAAGCQGLRSNRQRRLDLDRLTPFLLLLTLVGLRLIKTLRAGSDARLPPTAALIAQAIIACFAALAATVARLPPWRHFLRASLL